MIIASAHRFASKQEAFTQTQGVPLKRCSRCCHMGMCDAPLRLQATPFVAIDFAPEVVGS